jgi:hypothetical protein
MIGTALDQAQKLFGRGFLIAAFVPSLLFITVLTYLWWGFEALKITVQGWAQKDLKESAFETLLLLSAVYLLAYVLYGVRAAVHQLYHGQWPVPLRWLRSVALIRVHRTMGRCQATLREKEGALDDPAWAIDFGFAETHTAIRLAPEEARLGLQKVRASHQSMLQRLKDGQEVQDKLYWDILREARVLQANRDWLPNLREEINQERRRPYFFKSFRARTEPARNFFMRQAGRATAAAPTYFEPGLIELSAVGRLVLVDGGVFANNPAMCAWAEARKIYPEAADILVLSLGTGHLTRPYPYEDAASWGLAGWARPVLDVMFDGVSDAVDYQLRLLLPGRAPRRYYRLQTALIVGNDDMDDASNTNLRALKGLAEELIQDNSLLLDELVEQLTGAAAPVT